MAGKWIECSLADACSSIDYGLTAAAADHKAGPKLLRITDIVSGHIDWDTVPHVAADDETTAKYRLRDGGIVIARTGASTGASAYVKNPPAAVFASYLVRLQAKPEFDPRFLAYYLRSDDFWTFIRGVLGDKSAQPNASASTMTKAPLRVPEDKDEQHAIAHVLGTLDDKIELNRRMNETLEAIARAIFKSWFVYATEDGLPEGWRVVSMPDAVEINPPRSLQKGEVAPYVDMQNMPTRGHRPLGWINRKFGSGMRFINGDTLLARITPCLENGKTAFVDWLADGQVGWGSTEYIVLRPKPPLPPEYAYYLVRSEELRTHAIQNMTGSSGRQRVPSECFAQFEIAVPSEPIARRFGEIAKQLMHLIRVNDGQSRTLAVLRDALLPKLISGELRVNGIERP